MANSSFFQTHETYADFPVFVTCSYLHTLVVFKAFERLVFTEVTECPLVEKLCNINTQIWLKGVSPISSFPFLNVYLSVVRNGDANKAADS